MLPLTGINPRWGTFWDTTKTQRGFAKSDDYENKISYRNATLQIFFHLPIFLNWVQQCVASHADDKGLCENARSSEDPAVDELVPCKICLLNDVIEAYWNKNLNDQAFEAAMDQFWKAVFNDWAGDDQEKRDSLQGGQDVAGFFPVLLEQLLEDAPEPFPDSLDNMFKIQAFDKHSCLGPNGCGSVTYHADDFDFLPATFGEDETRQTMEEAVENSFLVDETDEVCPACKNNTLQMELVLGEIPEVLFVQLGRTVEYIEESGEHRKKKIGALQIGFSEELVISHKYLDPRLGNARKDVKYQLSSVLIHLGCETMQKGNYMAVSKSRDGSWTAVNNELLTPCVNFEDFAGRRDVKMYAYMFVYRRLPLVARGSGVSLKDSLTKAKYNPPEAGNDDEVEVDDEAAETSANVNVIQSPEDIVVTDASPLNVAQSGNVTDIELDEKQRGNLEIKFTDNSGVTTLNVHVKGMLWNGLKNKPQGRSGGPVTRSMASLNEASSAVVPKPAKINSKSSKEKRAAMVAEEATRRSGRVTKPNSSAKMNGRK